MDDEKIQRPRIAVYQQNVKGCFECPHKRYYSDPNNLTSLFGYIGCHFKYGPLPEMGFPKWCPLKELEHED